MEELEKCSFPLNLMLVSIVEVAREADDLCKIDGKNIYIHTQFCLEYSVGAETILDAVN